ncbi:MAG: aspartyl-phosphate phosphatase Spo0E family protein [Clostridiaceae bacterium]|nr:aspartyl-phosphate phosphatase Spo0E family protein [Clostridiaceae bacterium]
MLNDRINALRNKLDSLLSKDVDYEEVYAISIELDKLIVEYYYNRMKIEGKRDSATVRSKR